MAYEKQNFKDGQVLTAEQLNKMEEYFRYCPQCYTEYGDEIIHLPETQPVFVDDMYVILDAINGVTAGGVYNVTYNGVNYECVASGFNTDGVELAVLGNCAEFGLPSNDEPFAIVVIPESMVESLGIGAQIYVLDGASEVTVAITGREEIIHRLPSRYLPEVIELRLNADMTFSCKYSPSELYNLMAENHCRDFIVKGNDMYSKSEAVLCNTKLNNEDPDVKYNVILFNRINPSATTFVTSPFMVKVTEESISLIIQ